MSVPALQSHLQSRRVAEICNSPPGREGPKFVDSVEGKGPGEGKGAVGRQ